TDIRRDRRKSAPDPSSSPGITMSDSFATGNPAPPRERSPSMRRGGGNVPLLTRAAEFLTRRPVLYAFTAAAVATFLMFPGICLFQKTPLLGSSWELQDPAVS